MKRFVLALLFALLPSLAFGQPVNWGDYQDSNQTIYLYFNTVGTDGVAETLAGTPAIEIYEDGGDTQITSAETLTASADSVVGLNRLAVDLSDAGFEDGKTYTCVLSAGTVDSVSVVGRVVGVFSVGRYAIAPDGFDGLDIDGSGAVIIQDGTGAGQIATTSGAIDTVTTVTQLTAATTEPTSPPSATASFIDKVNWLFLIARNKKTVTDAQSSNTLPTTVRLSSARRT
jgi:hypothetical protein